MYLWKLVVAIAGSLLLGAPVGTGWAESTAEHKPAHQVHGSIPNALGSAKDTYSSAATVIERTLGDRSVETIVVGQGTIVRLILHAPADTELHLHGYDLAGTATGATPVVMMFRADHAGRFAIEAHGIEDILGRPDRALAYVEVRLE